MIRFLLLCFLTVGLFGQDKLTKTTEYDSPVYFNNNLRVELNTTSYKIYKENSEIFSAAVSGKKIFSSSKDKSHFFIVSFPFTSEKKEYEISVDVFNSAGEKKYSYSINSFFDLPHPLFNINNSGLLSVYDPLSYKLFLIDETGEREIALIKDAPFEMERGAFIEATNDYIFILTSHKPLSIEESSPNVSLYKINIASTFVNEYKLNYSTATLFNMEDENLYISGIQFENSLPQKELVKYDLNVNLIASAAEASEALIFEGEKIFSKYGDMIYRYNKDLMQEKSYHLNNKWIKEISFFNNQVIAFCVSEGSQYLIGLSDDLNIDFEIRLDIFTFGVFREIESRREGLLLRFENSTLVFN